MVYTIRCVNDRITIFSYANGMFEPLKNKGEKSQKFQVDNFWEWFERKVAYDGELISFIIITDKKEFEVPKHFKLDENFKLDSNLKEYIDTYIENYFLITQPLIEISLEPQASKSTHKKPPQKIKKGSISEYYLNQTKMYKNL